jgi:hypothetical protein
MELGTCGRKPTADGSSTRPAAQLHLGRKGLQPAGRPAAACLCKSCLPSGPGLGPQDGRPRGRVGAVVTWERKRLTSEVATQYRLLGGGSRGRLVINFPRRPPTARRGQAGPIVYEPLEDIWTRTSPFSHLLLLSLALPVLLVISFRSREGLAFYWDCNYRGAIGRLYVRRVAACWL